LDRDTLEILRMLRESARRASMEPPSRKREVRAEIDAAMAHFAGPIMQLPSQSAVARETVRPRRSLAGDDNSLPDELDLGVLPLLVRHERVKSATQAMDSNG